MNPQKHDLAKDLIVSASGIVAPIGGYSLNGNDLLLLIGLINGVLSAGYLLYRWWFTVRKVRRWERQQTATGGRPQLGITGPGDLDE